MNVSLGGPGAQRYVVFFGEGVLCKSSFCLSLSYPFVVQIGHLSNVNEVVGMAYFLLLMIQLCNSTHSISISWRLLSSYMKV